MEEIARQLKQIDLSLLFIIILLAAQNIIIALGGKK
jgi:hypothetical protein